MVTIWLSKPPEQCDLCKQPLGDYMIDGKTEDGPWAIMCPSCHRYHGFGFGLGHGQLYERYGKTWRKVSNPRRRIEHENEFGQRI